MATNGFTVTPTSGHSGVTTITVSATSLTSDAERGVWIDITAGTLTKSVLAFQDNAKHHLDVTPPRVYLPSTGGSASFHIDSDENWVLTNQTTWATFSQLSGSSTSVTVSAGINRSVDTRSAMFMINTPNITGSVYVEQPSAASLNVTPNPVYSDSGASSTYMTITSNSGWTISTLPDWVTASQVSGTGNTTVVLYCTSFTGEGTRTGTITINYGDGSAYQIGIIQYGKYWLSVEPDSFNLGYNAGNSSLTIQSDCNWELSSESVYFSVTAGSGNSVVTFTYPENTSSAATTGNILLQYGKSILESQITIPVTRAQKPTINVNPTSLLFDGQGGSLSISIDSNINWSITGDSWITFSSTSGTSGSTTVSVNVPENSDWRRGHFYVNNSIYIISKEVEVTQSVDALTITPSQIVFGPYTSGQSDSVDFTIISGELENFDFEPSDWFNIYVTQYPSGGTIENPASGSVYSNYINTGQTTPVIYNCVFTGTTTGRIGVLQIVQKSYADSSWSFTRTNTNSVKPVETPCAYKVGDGELKMVEDYTKWISGGSVSDVIYVYNTIAGVSGNSTPTNILSVYTNTANKVSNFQFNSGLTNVVIGTGTTEISDYTFNECRSLTGLTFETPCNVKYLSGFDYCPITAFTVPDTVETIGEYAFYGDTIIDDFSFGNSQVKTIKDFAFWYSGGTNPYSGEDWLYPLRIPDSVETIGTSAFMGRTRNALVIGTGVTSIGDAAFRPLYYGMGLLNRIYLDSINNITLGTNVFEQPEFPSTGVFYYRTGAYITQFQQQLPNWTFVEVGAYPESFEVYRKTIGIRAGQTIEVPVKGGAWGYRQTSNDIQGVSVSFNATGFTVTAEITPDDGEELTYTIFDMDGTGSVSIKINNGADVYFDVTSTNNLQVNSSSEDSPETLYYSRNGGTPVLYTGETIPSGTTRFYCDYVWYQAFRNSKEHITDIYIASGVNDIRPDVFSYCTGLTSVTIGSGLTVLPTGCFMDCKSLPNIVIPNTIENIQAMAFMNCYSLSSVTIPDSVTEIGNAAFEYCTGLTSVTIGRGVGRIDRNAFGECTSLSVIYCYSPDVFLVTRAFYDVPGGGTFYYVAGADISKFQSQLSTWTFVQM